MPVSCEQEGEQVDKADSQLRLGCAWPRPPTGRTHCHSVGEHRGQRVVPRLGRQLSSGAVLLAILELRVCAGLQQHVQKRRVAQLGRAHERCAPFVVASVDGAPIHEAPSRASSSGCPLHAARSRPLCPRLSVRRRVDLLRPSQATRPASPARTFSDFDLRHFDEPTLNTGKVEYFHGVDMSCGSNALLVA